MPQLGGCGTIVRRCLSNQPAPVTIVTATWTEKRLWLGPGLPWPFKQLTFIESQPTHCACPGISPKDFFGFSFSPGPFHFTPRATKNWRWREETRPGTRVIPYPCKNELDVGQLLIDSRVTMGYWGSVSSRNFLTINDRHVTKCDKPSF